MRGANWFLAVNYHQSSLTEYCKVHTAPLRTQKMTILIHKNSENVIKHILSLSKTVFSIQEEDIALENN